MTKTVIKAPAKLTLNLEITGVRDDGYHLLKAEMVTVNLFDSLEISEADKTTLKVIGGSADIPTDDSNIIYKALQLAERNADVVLNKAIPSGGGLGGGSADAGAILRWAQYVDYLTASKIGADVPFCINGGRAMVSGIGEIVEPLPFEEKIFTLYCPGIHCPTPQIYHRWDEMGGPKGKNGNDLEPAVLDLVPEMIEAKEKFANLVDLEPRLAGSGSTWFVEGIYQDIRLKEGDSLIDGDKLIVCQTV